MKRLSVILLLLTTGCTTVAVDTTEPVVTSIETTAVDCPALVAEGLAARRQLDFAVAEAHYLACLAHETYPAALLNLGILYEMYLGKPAEALALYESYQQLFVDESTAPLQSYAGLSIFNATELSSVRVIDHTFDNVRQMAGRAVVMQHFFNLVAPRGRV